MCVPSEWSANAGESLAIKAGGGGEERERERERDLQGINCGGDRRPNLNSELRRAPTEETMKEKTKRRLEITSKICGILALLYLFICSLDLLSTGFQLLVGESAGNIFFSISKCFCWQIIVSCAKIKKKIV